MTLRIEISEDGRHHVAYDDMNPRIYHESWKCTGCGIFVEESDVTFVESTDTDLPDPYCIDCIPDDDEPEDK